MRFFAPHQAPPNLTRGVVGWLGDPEGSPNAPHLKKKEEREQSRDSIPVYHDLIGC
jgi:hypothetical protein